VRHFPYLSFLKSDLQLSLEAAQRVARPAKTRRRPAWTPAEALEHRYRSGPTAGGKRRGVKRCGSAPTATPSRLRAAKKGCKTRVEGGGAMAVDARA